MLAVDVQFAQYPAAASHCRRAPSHAQICIHDAVLIIRDAVLLLLLSSCSLMLLSSLLGVRGCHWYSQLIIFIKIFSLFVLFI